MATRTKVYLELLACAVLYSYVPLSGTDPNGVKDDWRHLSSQSAPDDSLEDSLEWFSNTEPLPLCTMEEVGQGSWNPVTLDAPPFIPRKSKCYSHEQLTLNLTTANGTGFPYFHWIPNNARKSSCQYEHEWDAQEFCRLAHNKTVALMGDSLTWEHFASLAGHLGRQVGAHDQLNSKTDDGIRYSQKSGFILQVCNQTVKLAFKRHRYLSNVHDFLEMADPDILVLNRGAHHVDDKGFIDNAQWIADKWRGHQNKCTEQGRNCTLFWRTTAPGHPRCVNYTEPATNATEMEELISWDPEGDPTKYKGAMHYYYWWDFQRMNNILVDLFRNESDLHFDYLPAYEPNLLRPDAHMDGGRGDCLHHCDPGSSVDIYNVMLTHAMKRQLLAI